MVLTSPSVGWCGQLIPCSTNNTPRSPPVGRVPKRGPTPPSSGSLYTGPFGRRPASPNAPPATRLVQPSGRWPGFQPGLPGGRMPPGKPQPGRKMGGRHRPPRPIRNSGRHHLWRRSQSTLLRFEAGYCYGCCSLSSFCSVYQQTAANRLAGRWAGATSRPGECLTVTATTCVIGVEISGSGAVPVVRLQVSSHVCWLTVHCRNKQH